MEEKQKEAVIESMEKFANEMGKGFRILCAAIELIAREEPINFIDEQNEIDIYHQFVAGLMPVEGEKIGYRLFVPWTMMSIFSDGLKAYMDHNAKEDPSDREDVH